MGYRPFDADNHYYEALDAFSRHLDPALATRVFQWSTIDGRTYPVLGGQVFRGVRNATFDPVAKPGVLADYFRGNPHGDDPIALLRQHEPIRAEYRDRDARLATLDAHGLERAWLFPTLGMIYEEPLRHDVDAVTAAVHRLQPLAGGGLGLRPPGPPLRRPLHHPGRRRLGLPGAGVGPRPRRPHRGHAPGRPHHPPRPPLTGVDPSIDPFWARVARGRHHRRRPRRRRRLHRPRLRRATASAPTSGP